MKTYWLDEIDKTNIQALLEEVHANGDIGMQSLYAWYLGERDLIVHTIEVLDNWTLATNMS